MAQKTEPTFEQALAGLEQAATALAQDNVPLEEALQLFEAGMIYHEQCEKILSAAKQRIERYDRQTGCLIEEKAVETDGTP